MPSPLGHALGGLIVSLALDRNLCPRGQATERVRDRWRRADRRLLAVCLGAALLPDADFAWGRHNMETHSLGFAALLGLVAGVGFRSRVLGLGALLAASTHVLFDWLGSDDFPPLGVMALWPISSAFYFADAFVFEAISRRYWLPGFVQHNLLAVAREVLILGPVAAIVYWWSSRRGRRP